VADGEQAFSLAENGELHFEMPPLTLSDEPELADADVPDDVAEAVRRAIAAIESASVPAADAADGSGPVSPLEIDAQLPEIADVAVIEESDVLVSSDPESPVALAGSPASSGFGGFAPPSMATRAEVLYGMMTYDSAASNDSAVEQSAAPTFGESSPAAGVASVVFVDDPVEAGGSGNERSSALRRLIGSLRRKDH
jgi:hypothetical protein